jgi:transposase InsO family protein
VRDYLKEMEVHQEFTHVGTPEENCHIEALHSILEREVESRFEFATLEDLERVLAGYFLFYNRERIHSSLG